MNDRQTAGAAVETTEEEDTLPLRDLFRIIQRRLALILLAVTVVTGAVVGFDLTRTPMYEASIKILIGQEQITDNLAGQEQGLLQLTLTMAEAVNSRRVAEAAVQEPDPDLQMAPETLLKNLSAEGSETTRFVQVHYRDSDPQRAQLIANTVGKVFVEEVSEVVPTAESVTTTVWERAAVPDEPVSPNPGRDVLLAMVVGLMLGIGLAFLLEYQDDSWRSQEEVERAFGVPVFCVIPKFTSPNVRWTAKSKKRRGD